MKSSNIEMVIALFEKLEREKFYGNLDCTFQAGKLAHIRKYESVQDFEIVAQAWDKFSKEAQLEFTEKYSRNAKFVEAMRKNVPIVLKTPEKLAS